ncbi:2-oxo acid dehydrogenase subunit E2 [Leucobacter weissii]|uniref:Dihydrolipoamide acetyltransferase component of pyruvate dehydrogenase complex n=1 Tax=Leucobacter weissii TaxID=1983706 RepID=A0A939MIE5_9MICO|nr:dihydrolipoamide acetyltransferase family protein [Leucobacter weissii]MBO1901503.1 2-oxo acid dehydrogenase subunit E2 [Leucobacter weissii]
MAVLIRMPEVLANVTEAAIQSWLVAEGDTVAADTPLAEIETEKAMIEFAGENAGVVAELLAPTGETIAVGEPIAILRQEGDSDADVDAVRPSGGASNAAATPEEPAPPAGAAPDSAPEPAPRDLDEAAQAPTEEAPRESGESGERLFSSPIVRRLARERGIELARVTGTGPGGRIVRRDLDAFVPAPARAAAPAAEPAPSGSAPPTGDQPGEAVPLTGMRKAIARRLTESKSTVPHFYLTADCRVDELFALRKTVNESASRKISVNDFVVKAAAQALADVPEANAIWGGDHIRRFETVDIAVAVSTEGGLLTPVVRDINALSLTAVSATIADLAERARAGRLTQSELEGGSFSISNLGMYGVDEFSAILNPPQSGILAVGAASQRPIVTDGELAVGTVMTVTLSADHRVVDGALAAQWLQAFRARIEHPFSILV